MAVVASYSYVYPGECYSGTLSRPPVRTLLATYRLIRVLLCVVLPSKLLCHFLCKSNVRLATLSCACVYYTIFTAVTYVMSVYDTCVQWNLSLTYPDISVNQTLTLCKHSVQSTWLLHSQQKL